MYPSRILHHKYPSPVNISHKVWMVLISWNSSHVLSASDTTLPRSALWIKCTYISANVSCQHNGLALLAFVSQNTSRTHCGCRPLLCTTPNNVATSSSNALWQKFFVMSWPSLLTTIEFHALICNGHPSYINNPPMAKSLAPVYTSKGLSNSANLSMSCKNNLFLSSPKVGDKGHPTFGKAIF